MKKMELFRPDSRDADIKVVIEDEDDCPRYCAGIFKNVKTDLRQNIISSRLKQCGIRSVNNIVDITNYLLIELGQPLHAFDMDKLLSSTIYIRRGRKGEKITTIDHREYHPDEDVLLICSENHPVAIAGIMGGLDTEVDQNTNNILLESALFKPSLIRKGSKRLLLKTEASYRFERGVDPEGIPIAILRAGYLFKRTNPDIRFIGMTDNYPGRIERKPVSFFTSSPKNFLGIDIEEKEARDIFENLNFKIEKQKEGILTLIPPSFRWDITLEQDLLEEIARVKGLEVVPSELPHSKLKTGKENNLQKISKKVREYLIYQGFDETVSYSFIREDMLKNIFRWQNEIIRIKNPISESGGVLSPSPIYQLILSLNRNYKRMEEEAALFEIARCFDKKDKDIEETLYAVGGWYGDVFMNGDKDFYFLKGVVENTLFRLGIKDPTLSPVNDERLFQKTTSAELFKDGLKIARFGILSSEILKLLDMNKKLHLFEINLTKIEKIKLEEIQFKEFSKSPPAFRDISLVCEEGTSYSEVISVIKKAGGKNLESIKLKDIYHGSQIPIGSKGLTFHLVFRKMEGTLSDNEVDTAIENIIFSLKKINVGLR